MTFKSLLPKLLTILIIGAIAMHMVYGFKLVTDALYSEESSKPLQVCVDLIFNRWSVSFMWLREIQESLKQK